MRTVFWSQSARNDLRSQLTYIAADNPVAANSVAQRIYRSAEALSFMPTGRRGRVGGTYEKVVTGLPYILAYAIDDATDSEGRVVILHVIHGARNWPPGRWPE